MLPPEEAEGRLLMSITTTTDLAMLIRKGVTSSAMLVYGELYDYYRGYVRLYNELPTYSDLQVGFKGQVPEYREPGNLDYYTEEVLRNYQVTRAHAAVIERFGEDGRRLQESPDEMIRLLSEDLRKMQRTETEHVSFLDRDALERLEWLKESAAMAAAGSVMGIPTGLLCFDGNMQGWEAGEAVMLMGPKGVGKSWLSQFWAVVAHQEGYKVLYLSPEMSNRQCGYRFDVLLAHRLGTQLSHEALQKGLTDQEVYENWLRKLTRYERYISIDSAMAGGFTISNTLGYLDEHRPDLMVLDGIHLLGSEERQSGWETIKQAADALKAAAQHLKCTVIWTSQVDSAAMANPTEPAATGSSAAYGKASVEAANRLITLARYEGDDKRRTFKVPNNRSGKEYHARLHLRFDVDIGHIEQVPPTQIQPADGDF